MGDWTDKLSRERPVAAEFLYEPYRDAASMSGLMPKAYSDYELFADPESATFYESVLDDKKQTPESLQDFLRMYGFDREAKLPSKDDAFIAVEAYQTILEKLAPYQKDDGSLDEARIAGGWDDGVGAAILADLGAALLETSNEAPRVRRIADNVNAFARDEQLAWDRANNPDYDAERLVQAHAQREDEDADALYLEEEYFPAFERRAKRERAYQDADADEREEIAEEERNYRRAARRLF